MFDHDTKVAPDPLTPQDLVNCDSVNETSLKCIGAEKNSQQTVSGVLDQKKRKYHDPLTCELPNCQDLGCEVLSSFQKFRATHQRLFASPKRHKMEQEMETESNIISERVAEQLGINESLTVIDVGVALKMFQQLQSEMAALKNNVPTVDMKEKIKAEIEQDLNTAMQNQEKKIAELEDQLRSTQRKAKITEDVLRFNNSVMEDIVKRLDSLELANARRAAIITGLNVIGRKFEKIEKVTDFLCQELEIYMKLEDVYQIGDSDRQPIVVIFQTMTDKNVVFANKERLKEYGTDENKGKVYINHYLPAGEAEKRKRE